MPGQPWRGQSQGRHCAGPEAGAAEEAAALSAAAAAAVAGVLQENCQGSRHTQQRADAAMGWDSDVDDLHTQQSLKKPCLHPSGNIM